MNYITTAVTISQDMLLITYEDGMQIDVGYIEEDKTYCITVVKDDTMESWNNPLGIFSTSNKSKIPTELQKAIHKFRIRLSALNSTNLDIV